MAENCGGALQTVETQDVKFVTNFGQGNGLNSGAASLMTCITPSTLTYESVQTFIPGAPCGGSFGPCNRGGYKGVTTTTWVQHGRGQGNWSYQFSPFNINVEAKMDMFYRNVGGRNHLIVRLYDIWSYLVGPDQNIDYNFYAGLYMGGNTSYALAATTWGAPPEDMSMWRTCLGGWWSGAAIDPCSMGACPEGESHQEPGGGTSYLWGRNQRWGTKFEHHGNTPARMDGPIEFDLGEPTNYGNTAVFIWGRMMTGGDNNCNGAYWRGNASYMGNAYKAPIIRVCPPELDHITQDRDICHNCAITDFYFKPNDLLEVDTGTLILEYFYNAPADMNAINWANAEVAQWTISKHTDIHVNLPCLDSGSHYCWRAKIRVESGNFVGESDYTYGCFDTLFIPEKTWVVPDISTEECELISRGGFVPQYEERPAV